MTGWYQLTIAIVLLMSSTIAPCLGSSEINDLKNESVSQIEHQFYPNKLFKTPSVVYSRENINGMVSIDTIGWSVHNTTDGGYVIGGGASAYNYETNEMYYQYGLLIKFTANGQEEWNCTLKSGYITIYSCDQTKDNEYIATGSIHQPCDDDGYTFLAKIDEQGSVLWERFYYIQNYSIGQSVQHTSDGGYILGGFTRSSFYLLKTDQEGNQQWLSLSSVSASFLLYVQQTSDNGYVVVGTTGTYDNSSAFIFKFNNTGGEEWNNTYKILNNTISVFIQQTHDSGLIITGQTFSDYTEMGVMFLLKTDEFGQEEWNQTYINSIYPLSMGICVHQTLDHGYIILELVAIGGDFFTNGVLLKTDENGIEQWNTTLDYRIPLSIDVTNDQGYIITSWNLMGDNSILIKVQENGTIEWMQPYSWKDYTPPTLGIISPTNGLYLRGHQFLPHLQKTIIVGEITVKVDAFDTDTEVVQVNYYVDDDLICTDVVPPFEWIWDERSFSHHIIKVIADDALGNQDCQIQHVFKIF